MAESFFKKVIQTGAKAAEIAAPIVGGALGGPAGAAAGASLGKGIGKIAQAKPLGGKGFTPSSASSIGQARSQDKTRMKAQYGMGGADNEIG